MIVLDTWDVVLIIAFATIVGMAMSAIAFNAGLCERDEPEPCMREHVYTFRPPPKPRELVDEDQEVDETRITPLRSTGHR